MLKKIEKGTLPVYLQLYSMLKEDIIRKIYLYGEKLPSKRILAQDTGLSLVSVEHALELLCDEGYIRSSQRSGYFVSYSSEGKNDYSEPEIKEVFSSPRRNSSDFPISVLTKAMRYVITNQEDMLLQKSPNNGMPELRDALCRYLARSRGIRVSPSDIVIGSGAEYLYSILTQMFGTEAVYGIESPSYDMIRKVYTANGVTCDLLKLGKEGILSSELERTPAKVLHVTPYMSFPTGVCATASKKHEYIEWAKKRDAFIIEDDFDSEFTPSAKAEDTLFSLDQGGKIVYLNTFSKTIAPSMRVGYAVLSPALRELFQKKASFYSCSVPVFEQLLIARLLSDGDFERHVNRVRRKRKKSSGS